MSDEWGMPWNEPIGFYDSERIYEAMEFLYKGVNFRVEPTGKVGVDTGRDRTLVRCLSCNFIVHPATTGPASRVHQHWEEKHG